jgi:hypothetical protein
MFEALPSTELRYVCKGCETVFVHVGYPSNRFLSLCKSCKTNHDKEMRSESRKRNLTVLTEAALKPMKVEYENVHNTNLLLTDNERVLVEQLNEFKKKLKISEASNARLESALQIVNQRRKGAPSECIVPRERLNKTKSYDDALLIRLKLKLAQEDLLSFYRSSFYSKLSEYQNVCLVSPDEGLFCSIFIKRGHRFIVFVGNKMLYPREGVRKHFNERDVKYILHLDKSHILDCSKTSLRGVCMASKINSVKGLLRGSEKAIANAKISSANKGVICVIAIDDIQPNTEIFVKTYGSLHKI